VLDVPNSAPIDVAVASANRALSILDLKPFDSFIAFSSAASKIPDLRPQPIKVPMVSKVSVKLKAKIITSATKTLSPLKRLAKPISPKKAKVTSLIPESADRSKSLAGTCVTPIGMPINVAPIIPISIAPFTLSIIKITMIARPMSARTGPASLNVLSTGTGPPISTIPALTKPM
jgi:hypothetical protein